jgi:hypothetical protein
MKKIFLLNLLFLFIGDIFCKTELPSIIKSDALEQERKITDEEIEQLRPANETFTSLMSKIFNSDIANDFVALEKNSPNLYWKIISEASEIFADPLYQEKINSLISSLKDSSKSDKNQFLAGLTVGIVGIVSIIAAKKIIDFAKKLGIGGKPSKDNHTGEPSSSLPPETSPGSTATTLTPMLHVSSNQRSYIVQFWQRLLKYFETTPTLSLFERTSKDKAKIKFQQCLLSNGNPKIKAFFKKYNFLIDKLGDEKALIDFLIKQIDGDQSNITFTQLYNNTALLSAADEFSEIVSLINDNVIRLWLMTYELAFRSAATGIRGPDDYEAQKNKLPQLLMLITALDPLNYSNPASPRFTSAPMTWLFTEESIIDT